MRGTDSRDRSVSRRDFLRGGAALAGTASMGALLPSLGRTRGTSRRSAPVTVNHWDWWVSQSPWVENEIKLFQKAYPDIKIKRTVNATATYDQLFTLAERSGNVPDTFMISTTTLTLNDQVAKGWLLPLNKWANGSWLHEFPAYSFAEGNNVNGGKVYTAPFSGNAPSFQLFVNTKVFKEAGLTDKHGNVKLPKTWDDVTHAAETIVKKSNGTTYGLGFGNSSFAILPWWTDVFVRAAGAPGGSGGQDLRTGKFTFGSNRNYRDFFQLILEWKNKGYFYPDSISISDEISRAYFSRGKFGMTVGGVWNQPEWTQDVFTDYVPTTLIGPEATRKGYFYSAPGGSLLAISSKSQITDAAWEWFKWWQSPAAGKRWTQTYHEDMSVFSQNNKARAIHFKPFADYVALADLEIPGPHAAAKNPQEAFVTVQAVTPNFGTTTTGIYTGQIKDIQSAFSELDGRMSAALNTGLQQAQQQGYKVSINDYVFPDWDPTKPYKWTIPQYPKLQTT